MGDKNGTGRQVESMFTRYPLLSPEVFLLQESSTRAARGLMMAGPFVQMFGDNTPVLSAGEINACFRLKVMFDGISEGFLCLLVLDG